MAALTEAKAWLVTATPAEAFKAIGKMIEDRKARVAQLGAEVANAA